MENTRVSHYEIGRRLGRGGMGEVYEALDLDLDRRVALKFVAPELAADADALKRFEREARAAAALTHPHIATLYAFERDGARSFIAMELVGGESVRDRLHRGPLPIAEALAIARDIAGALALAHRRGVVHRDVKPENLMFDQDGVVKLMDFGLARAAQASRMTMSGSTLGTAAYMPPESMRGGAEAPGDVYALGVTLHEMVAGALPFRGDSPLALLYTSANEDPIPLRAARPDAPTDLEALIARMLAKDPGRRPDAAAVGRALAAMAGTAPPAGAGDTLELPVERMPAAGAGGDVLVRSGGDAWPATPTRARRRPWLVLALIAIAAVVALALLVPRALREQRVTRQREAWRLTDEGVDSLVAGNPAVAQRRFEAALALEPGYGKAQVSLGRTFHVLGDDARAAQVLRQVLDRPQGDRGMMALALDALADIDMAAGNWSGAVESLRRSFELDSSSVRAHNQLAYALIRAGHPDEAIDLLIRAIPRFPGQAVLHKNLGLAELTMGDVRGAATEADRALAIDPSFAPALVLRARARARSGDLAGARADWGGYLLLRTDPADSAQAAAELLQRGVIR